MGNKLYGAILGDLCGQPMELQRYTGDVVIHNPDSHITDDTVMTLATAYAIMNKTTFESAYKYFGKMYNTDGKNGLGYGSAFAEWIYNDFGKLNNSFGNGCLMRMSPIIYAAETEREMDFMIAASCYNSHAHIDSYTSCLALKDLYLGMTLYLPDAREIVPFTSFKVRAIPTIDFVSNVYMNMITKGMTTQECILAAVHCGGDTDTNASIVGELCNAQRNDLTDEDVAYVESKLDTFLLSVLKEFNEKYV